ncbi:MAG: lipoate--protein ligase family protein [Planctomycetota bacterium]
MAVDAALLEVAEVPTLRLYGWRPHAVSLGYFQSLAAFADVPDTTPVVRRSTGGGAIFHGDELTFSLALDGGLLPADVAASYTHLHDAVARALAALGVTCWRATTGRMSARPSDRWCFEHPVQGDLLTDAGKLCGSAQRRERGRVLHHGSLVLRRPTPTPFVAAVEDQVEPTATVRRGLRAALVSELAAALSLQPSHGALEPAEDARARALERDVYGAAGHTARR